MYIYIYVCIDLYMCTFLPAYANMCAHVHDEICIKICVAIILHAYLHMCTCIYTCETYPHNMHMS